MQATSNAREEALHAIPYHGKPEFLSKSRCHVGRGLSQAQDRRRPVRILSHHAFPSGFGIVCFPLHVMGTCASLGDRKSVV